MSSHTGVSRAVRGASVVADTHRPVARRRQGLEKFGVIAIAMTALLASACGGGTYCQTGPKYGTQCYDVQQPGPGNMPPAENGSVYPTAASSRGGTPNGQKP
ncbi:MAG TPA: hypothetical protein VHC69_35745 [Polyangiaceae bacterium]|nr:hypothetical protein [Polyangiaceae bacterium]